MLVDPKYHERAGRIVDWLYEEGLDTDAKRSADSFDDSSHVIAYGKAQLMLFLRELGDSVEPMYWMIMQAGRVAADDNICFQAVAEALLQTSSPEWHDVSEERRRDVVLKALRSRTAQDVQVLFSPIAKMMWIAIGLVDIVTTLQDREAPEIMLVTKPVKRYKPPLDRELLEYPETAQADPIWPMLYRSVVVEHL